MPDPPATHKAGPRFWLSAAAGWALVGVGLRGVLQHTVDTRPVDLARFVVGGALVHDLIVAPLVLFLGLVVTRAVRPRARPIVQAALVITAALALFAYPLVRMYGRATHNPTSLPHDYAQNLLLVLGLVWAATAVAVLVRLKRVGAGH